MWLLSQFDAVVHAAGLDALPFVTPALHFVRQILRVHPSLSGLLGELLIALEEGRRLHLSERPSLASLLDEAAQGVTLVSVVADGVQDHGRRVQAVALPCEASIDRPAQDARQLAP